MGRLKTNIIVDVAVLLAMAVLSLSGWVIKVIMPSGMHHRGMHSSAHDLLGWGRHTWREIHLWAGVVVLALVVLHIVLHWSVISAFFKRHIPNQVLRFVVYLLLLTVALATVAPWIYVMI